MPDFDGSPPSNGATYLDPQGPGTAGVRQTLFGISFTARPGKEAELERLLADEGLTRLAAERMGARTEALFVQGNRFTQVFEFAQGGAVEARSRFLAVEESPEFRDLWRRVAPLLSDPFDPEDATSFAAFVQRHKLRLAAEAHAGAQPPAAGPQAPLSQASPPQAPKTLFERVALGASPR
jgi:hypothetical protein